MDKPPNSVKLIVIDGVTYNLPKESNIIFNPDTYKTEYIATSGSPLEKRTRTVPDVTVDLIADNTDQTTLKDLAQKMDEINLSVKLHNDSIFLCTGVIVIKYSDKTNSLIIVNIIPSGSWQKF